MEKRQNMIKYVDKLYKFYKNFKFSYVLIFNISLVFCYISAYFVQLHAKRRSALTISEPYGGRARFWLCDVIKLFADAVPIGRRVAKFTVFCPDNL